MSRDRSPAGAPLPQRRLPAQLNGAVDRRSVPAHQPPLARAPAAPANVEKAGPPGPALGEAFAGQPSVALLGFVQPPGQFRPNPFRS